MFILKFRSFIIPSARILKIHARLKSSADLVPVELPVASKPSETFWQSVNKDKALFWIMTSAATGALAWLKSDINRLDQKIETGLGSIRTEMAQDRARVDAGFAQVNQRFDQLYALLLAGQQQKKEEQKQEEKDSSSWPGCR